MHLNISTALHCKLAMDQPASVEQDASVEGSTGSTRSEGTVQNAPFQTCASEEGCRNQVAGSSVRHTAYHRAGATGTAGTAMAVPVFEKEKWRCWDSDLRARS